MISDVLADASQQPRSPRERAIIETAYRNFPHYWRTVLGSPGDRPHRRLIFLDMGREALQAAEYYGNPWHLAQPQDAVMVDMVDLYSHEEGTARD